MSKDLLPDNAADSGKGQFLIYEAEDGKVKIDVRMEKETVWLTQQLMADLFQSSKQNINHHIQCIYEEGELPPDATVKKYLTVRREGKREVQRLLDYYNLDMIISVGYRVKSHVATRFRIWATQRLREYIIKGFVLMGLTNWRGTKVRKQDVTIAKNYLIEKELLALNNLVEQYLIFAEGQAMRRIPMHMAEWIKKT